MSLPRGNLVPGWTLHSWGVIVRVNIQKAAMTSERTPLLDSGLPRSGTPRRRRTDEQLRLIDLFAGAGGMTLGFMATRRFRTVWANDINGYAARTYNANFGDHCMAGDILDILRSRSFICPRADVVIGGPPCQGFSLLNKNRAGDPRKQLWRPFLDVVERSRAEVFVMENVPQLLGTREHDEIVEAAEALGFTVTWTKLNAADYGVPQTRWRAFIVGCKSADPAECFPPKKTHYNPNPRSSNGAQWNGEHVKRPSPWRVVRDAIADLPLPKGTEFRPDEAPPLDLHFGRSPTPLSMKRYRAVPKEGMNRFDLQSRAPHLTPGCWIRKKSGGTDLFGRLWWDRPAFTIRTEFFKPEKGRYLHPQQHRPLQSFPDSFIFTGTKIEVAKQIGNAVPPALAAVVANAVAGILARRGS
jgi:DNA (cytosine-5)-methyltransferase 1